MNEGTPQRIARTRTALPYVQSYVDRHGRRRHYFRRRSMKKVPLPGVPGSPEFERAYDALLKAPAIDKPRRPRAERPPARPPMAGVYLLLQGEEIVYVGTSANMQKRVASHRVNGRPFDRAFFIAATERDRASLERILIASIRPKQNRDGIKSRTPSVRSPVQQCPTGG